MKNILSSIIILVLINSSVSYSYYQFNSSPMAKHSNQDWDGICGDTDTRDVFERYDTDLKQVDHMGRLMFIIKSFNIPVARAHCSAFLVSNGTYLTAGHCFQENYFDVVARGFKVDVTLQFRVPESNDSGFPSSPRSEDSYDVIIPDKDSYSSIFDGEEDHKDDWAMFSVKANNMGSSVQRYPHFFRVASREYNNHPEDNLYGLGYETNYIPENAGMYHRGIGTIKDWSEEFPFLTHKIDAAIGDSGGPIYDPYLGLVVAMHSEVFCKSRGYNRATSLAPYMNGNEAQTELFYRLNNYWDTRLTPGVEYERTVHVDRYFHETQPNAQGCYSSRLYCDGTFEYPATTIESALAHIREQQKTESKPHLLLMVADNNIKKQEFVGKYKHTGSLEFPSNMAVFPTGEIWFTPTTAQDDNGVTTSSW